MGSISAHIPSLGPRHRAWPCRHTLLPELPTTCRPCRSERPVRQHAHQLLSQTLTTRSHPTHPTVMPPPLHAKRCPALAAERRQRYSAVPGLREKQDFFANSSWKQAGASPSIVDALVTLGIQKPSHVQAEAYAALQSGAPLPEACHWGYQPRYP